MNSIRTKGRFGFALAALVLAATCCIGADPKESAAPQAIRAVLDSQVEAWNRGNLEQFMAGYWNSKDLTFYSGKDKRLGWAETFERYKKRYQGEGKEMGRLSFSELEIEPLSAEHAIVKGRWLVQMSKEKFEGLFTLVMRKTPDGWKIIHDHTSN